MGRPHVPIVAREHGMIAYWIMFLVPVLAILSPLRGTAPLNRATWLLVGLLLVFLIGLRHQVGGDWEPTSSYTISKSMPR